MSVAQREPETPAGVTLPSLFGQRSFVAGLLITAGFFGALSAFVLTINLLQLGLHVAGLDLLTLLLVGLLPRHAQPTHGQPERRRS